MNYDKVVRLENWTDGREKRAKRRRKRAAKVEILGCVTKRDISPERVLKAASGQFDGAVVIGYDKDGEFYFASSIADGGDVNWLLDQAKLALLNTD